MGTDTSLAGKRILITGASSGLGRAMALEAARQGARLALCGRSPEKLALVTAAIGPEGSGIFSRAFDVTDEAAVRDFGRAAAETLGGLDVLINCAGANRARGPAAELSLADLDAMMRLNCYAPLCFMQAALPALSAAKGMVINILSTCCLFANEGNAAYTASKSALDGLTKVFRKEARKQGVRVCSVYPGGINTAFRAAVRPEYLNPGAAASAVLSLISLGPDIAPDEFVFRPLCENNFS